MSLVLPAGKPTMRLRIRRQHQSHQLVGSNRRSRHQRGFYKIPSSITLFWTTDVFFGQPIWLAQLNAVLWAKPFMLPAPMIWGLAHLRQRFVRWSQARV